MKLTAHCEMSSACLPGHPAVAYLLFVRLSRDTTTVHVTEGKYKRVCDEARLRALETSAPFEDIARRLEADMEIF